jgi:hypothetical protein
MLLAGNAMALGNCGFSYNDMGTVLDLMEDRLEDISNDGSFMMNRLYDQNVLINSCQS